MKMVYDCCLSDSELNSLKETKKILKEILDAIEETGGNEIISYNYLTNTENVKTAFNLIKFLCDEKEFSIH